MDFKYSVYWYTIITVLTETKWSNIFWSSAVDPVDYWHSYRTPIEDAVSAKAPIEDALSAKC
jgi:hypothetical protein